MVRTLGLVIDRDVTYVVINTRSVYDETDVDQKRGVRFPPEVFRYYDETDVGPKTWSAFPPGGLLVQKVILSSTFSNQSRNSGLVKTFDLSHIYLRKVAAACLTL